MSPHVVRGGLALNSHIGSSYSGAEGICVASPSRICHVPLAAPLTRPRASYSSHPAAGDGATDSLTQHVVGSDGSGTAKSCAAVLAGMASAATAAYNVQTQHGFASTATKCSGVAATTTVGVGLPEFPGSSTCEPSPTVTSTIRLVVRHHVGGNPSNPERNHIFAANAATSADFQLGTQTTNIENNHIHQVSIPRKQKADATVDHIQNATSRHLAASAAVTAGDASEQICGKATSTLTLPWTVSGPQEVVQVREEMKVSGAGVAHISHVVAAVASRLSPTAHEVDRDHSGEISPNVTGTATTPSIGPALLTSATNSPEIIKYRCPTCNELLSSLDEAVRHCDTSKHMTETRAGTYENKVAEHSAGGDCPDETPLTASVATRNSRAVPMLPMGEPIAFDEQGKPSIVRHKDGKNGSARTIVRNEDGSQRVFGQNTVASLTSSRFEDAMIWVAALTCHQVRGLVHEIGQRLLEHSQLYHNRLAEYEKLGQALHYRFFGLDTGATAKELDNAYRKLAKQMHPDKNGGTEEAKRRFQIMKERYEALKQKRTEAKCGQHEEECGEPQDLAPSCDKFEHKDTSLPASLEHLGRSGKGRIEDSGQRSISGIKDDSARLGEECENKEGAVGTGTPSSVSEKEATDEGKTSRSETASSIEYDPNDKESMVHTVSKMLKQLKQLEVQMKTLMQELDKARWADTTSCNPKADWGHVSGCKVNVPDMTTKE